MDVVHALNNSNLIIPVEMEELAQIALIAILIKCKRWDNTTFLRPSSRMPTTAFG